MNKLRTLIQQVTHYLSRFKKQDKKRGSPKLIKTTRKNVNILVLTGLGCLVFHRSYWFPACYHAIKQGHLS